MTQPTRAANTSDLLKAGGVAAVPAEQIANLIGNAFRQQLSRGPVQVDYTPEDMRLITAQARKYRFTNLDWEDTAAYRNSKRSSKRPEQERQLVDPARHPLSGSQPVTVTQAINEDQVFPGPYTDVLTQRRNSFAVYTIGLRLGPQKGTHARFNEGTKSIEGVPIEWDVDQSQFLKGTVRETADATKIGLALQNLQAIEIPVYSGGQWLMQPAVGWFTSPAYAPAANRASFYAEGTWTPSYESTSGTNPTLTYTRQDGRWIRVGNLVTVFGRIDVNAVTSTAGGVNVRIAGLPVTAKTTTAAAFSGSASIAAGWTNNIPTRIVVQSAGTHLALQYEVSATGTGGVPVGNLTAGCTLAFSISYPTDAL